MADPAAWNGQLGFGEADLGDGFYNGHVVCIANGVTID